jgi:Immunoglobulin I-set domain
VQQQNGEELAQLHVPIAQRSDTGKYAITVSNPFGQDTGTINVIVLGEIFSKHCKVKWMRTEYLCKLSNFH